MDGHAKRFEQKLQEVYEEVDKQQIRKLQHKMYICAANCFEDANRNSQQIDSCINNCNAPLLGVQQYLKNEFEDFQHRLQRCIMVCNDNAREIDAKGSTNSIVSENLRKSEFENCAVNCINKHIELMPNLLFKIKTTLEQHQT